jgi:hypothetical protein
LTASAFTRLTISFHHSDGAVLWRILSYTLELHISHFHGEPEAFLAVLMDGQVEFFFIAKGQYNSYFIFTEFHDGFFRRIGVGEAWFFWDNGHCYRFAEEMKFPAAKQKVCLV